MAVTESQLSSNLTVDPPLQLTADYYLTAEDRQYLANQVRALQMHIAQSLIRGQIGTWFRVSASSEALVPGNVVCSASEQASEDNPLIAERVVTKAVPAALALAGAPLGVVLTAAAPGGWVRVATGGLVAQSILGLALGTPGAVRVNGAALCERVGSFSSADYSVGYVDNLGNVSLVLGKGGGSGGAGLPAGGKGDLLWHDGSTWTDLDAGSNGQVLTIQSGVPRWLAPTGGGDGLPAGAEGDVLIYVDDAWQGLTAGASGEVLTIVDGVPSWEAPVEELPAGTKGDVLYFDGSAWISRGIGSANQVLTVVGGLPVWADPGDGEASTLPSGGKGDILVSDGTQWVPTEPGSEGEILAIVDGVPTWAPPEEIESDLPVGSKGDLLVHDGDEWTDLDIGTPGQQLTVGSGGMPEWQSDDVWEGAKGDVIYHDGAAWTERPIGSAGQVLTVVGGLPVWADPTGSADLPAGNEGDILVNDGSEWATVGIGSTGQVLTVVGGTAAWADPELELPSGGTDGQVLTIVDGTPEWADPETELPEPGDDDQVLTIVDGTPEWADVPTELPSGTKGDILRHDGSDWVVRAIGTDGQVLTVVAGEPAWSNPSASGSGVPVVRVVSTTNITLSGTQTIDEIAVIAGDRVLVAGQTDASENGIYDVASGAWSRASDMNQSAEAFRGQLVEVQEGAQHHDSLWMNTSAASSFVLDTDDMTFRRISLPDASEYGAVLIKTGPDSFDWRAGSDGMVLQMIGNEPTWAELPETSGSGDAGESAWQSITVDVALLIDSLPSWTAPTPNLLQGSANGAFPTVDGVSLVVGSPTGAGILLFGASEKCGVWQLIQQGSPSTPWQLARLSGPGVTAQQVVRANRVVCIRYGTNYGGRQFSHVTPTNLYTPGFADILLDTTEIVYLPDSSLATSVQEIATVDYALDRAESTSMLNNATQTGNAIEANSNGNGPFADSIQVSLNERVLIYGATGGGSSTMNGIWTCTRAGTGSTRWKLERSPDASSAELCLAIRQIFVRSGLNDRARIYLNYTQPAGFTLNSSPLVYGRQDDQDPTVVEAQLAVHITALGFVNGDSINPTRLRGATNGALPVIDGVTPAVANLDSYPILIYGSSPFTGVWSISNAGSPTSVWELWRVSKLDTNKKWTRNQAVVIKNGATEKGAIYVKTTRGDLSLNSTTVEYVKQGSGASGSSAVVIADVAHTIGTMPSHTRSGNRMTATANGVYPQIDGVAPSVGLRVLLFSSGVEAGVWQFFQIGSGSAPWMLDRVSELDSSTDVQANAGVTVLAGTTYGGKLFTRLRSGSVTINSTTLEWQQLGGGELAAGTTHSRPLVWNAITGEWEEFSGGSDFQGISIDGITSSTSARGVYVQQVGSSAARVVASQAHQSSAVIGTVSEFVSMATLASPNQEIGSLAFRVLFDIGSGPFGIPGSRNRSTWIGLRGAYWTENTDDQISADFAVAVHGGLFANRANVAESVGNRWYVGATREGGILTGHQYYEVSKVTSGTPVSTIIGTEQLRNGALVDTGRAQSVAQDTSDNTLTALTDAVIAVPANQGVTVYWQLWGRQSDNTDRIYAEGRYVVDRINGGSASEIVNAAEGLSVFEATAGAASAWGDETTIGPDLSGNNIIFNVQGGTGQTVSWQMDWSWVVR